MPTSLLRGRGEEGRMTERGVPLLLFQTMKGVRGNLKGIKRVETCTSAGTTLEEKPSCSVMEEDYTVSKESLASTSHQGMIKDPSVVISAHCMKGSTSLHAADLEQQSCTALYKVNDEEKIAFQNPMKCRNLIWDDGIPHGRCTKMDDGGYEEAAKNFVAWDGLERARADLLSQSS